MRKSHVMLEGTAQNAAPGKHSKRSTRLISTADRMALGRRATAA
eukprot:CAMPEP_0198567708 /NCGR_PEP_ID=MMETSP1462-20131121/105229_1 /TAXON_ID=1333877 /ORGANISM="Brandtodinium nutriculum, Strain RCC3387" /LENGTH=43 /DNA_ID= /DNA_START= /DNA_END= /DNA_ORIENTATION=